MNGVDEESVRDFVQYTSNEVIKTKGSAPSQQPALIANFDKDYEEYKNKKNQLTDEQISRFKGYNEISSAFDFQAPFEERLSEELTAVVKEFETRRMKSKEEIEKEEKQRKQMEKEK